MSKSILSKKPMTLMKLIIVLWYLLIPTITFAQKSAMSIDSFTTFFKEIETATKKNEQLWNRDLYGPILLVNPETRQCYAHVPDSAGVLNPSGKIWSGVLPQKVNIANTSIYWSGVNWAMVMLPLPS